MKSTSLHARLTLWLAALILILATLLALTITRIADRYHAEVTQRLNAGIAMYVTGELALIDTHGVNQQALAELSHRAMTVNPSVEVYLLAPDGAVLATLVDKARVVRSRIDLAPIREFLAGDTRRPLYGDDPTSSSIPGVFSVSPVNIDGRLVGYLYVVLASNKFVSVASAVRGNYTLQIALLVVVAILSLTLLAGAVLFRQLTLPLRQLSMDMHAWSRGMSINSNSQTTSSDDIASLRAQFLLLSNKIQTQMQSIADRDIQRRELLANLSHDLRTPLASLHGHIETVLLANERASTARQKEYLQIAHRDSQHLQRLINALFDLSRLETGSMELDCEAFSIAELLHDVALRFSQRAAAIGVEVATQIPRHLDTVRADLALIERVLENLIDNSLKHTPQGGRIILSARAAVNSIQVSIADTGSGIRPNDLPHVFDRLYRSGDSRGTGLGLAIVKRIVELHGQHVDIVSTLSFGTRVEFGLPLSMTTVLPSATFTQKEILDLVTP